MTKMRKRPVPKKTTTKTPAAMRIKTRIPAGTLRPSDVEADAEADVDMAANANTRPSTAGPYERLPTAGDKPPTEAERTSNGRDAH